MLRTAGNYRITESASESRHEMLTSTVSRCYRAENKGLNRSDEAPESTPEHSGIVGGPKFGPAISSRNPYFHMV
jgi:hypothetical protein